MIAIIHYHSMVNDMGNAEKEYLKGYLKRILLHALKIF